MGNGNSTQQLWALRHRKLDQVIPDTHSSTAWFDKSSKPFAGEKDREQFIRGFYLLKLAWDGFTDYPLILDEDGVITVLTNNGQLDLTGYNIRLLFSRREGDDQLVARIVAQLDGVIRAKLEPEAAGNDQTAAFLALKKDVEIKLEKILQGVPGSGGDVVAAGAGAGPSQPRNAALVPVEAPPAYEGDDVKRKPGKR
ncbi:hypothetical protein LTR62_007856 [Meristemomyces frigidus]|uniref:Uncharacterized protein n=1 Tax=Meristemomyces frigidus TaxID=1508187 RepID=A0AAN7YCZ9_9PEZI|nr:hypothetical protein LTR62_007856 [Meristemomyces frigidus]